MALVKLLNFVVQGSPGDIVRAWGFDFTIQKNRDAICDMPDEYVTQSVASGRVVTIDPTSYFSKENSEGSFSSFGKSAEDFFGFGDSVSFRDRLRKLRKDELVLFADDRLKLILPITMGKDALMFEIINQTERLASKKED